MARMKDERTNLFDNALCSLLHTEAEQKVEYVYSLQKEWLSHELTLESTSDIQSLPVPGRPIVPELVDAKDVPRRNIASLNGRLALVHAIAHIEFNAINLALDAIYRFQQMPEQYYSDWWRVAAEEALHFTMLSEYLEIHGVAYGDYPAHNGLWEMAVKTDSDVMVRMALVPRVLEARRLDVTPGMIKKLQSTGDVQLIAILQKIFDDEIGHVKIGSFWYKTLCEERGLEPEETFLELIEQYMKGAKFGPFDTESRLEAGFSEEEMKSLLERFN